MRFSLCLIALGGLLALAVSDSSPAPPEKEGKWKYPEAKKADVADEFHGTRVPDPYRWLEDPDAAETVAWVEAENRLTRKYLDAVPDREPIEKRLRALWDYPKYGVPERQGDRYFFSRNDGLQNQAVLYMVKSLDGEPVEILDPNRLSEDGTVALSGQSFSRDGTLLAYALSGSGSDRQEIRVRNIDTGRDYPEVLLWAKFASIAWRHDNSGFFYNRFPEPGTVPEEDENNYQRVYWHRLGTAQSEDALVFEMPDKKEIGFAPFITEDGRYLGLYVYHGTDPRNGFYYRPVEGGGEFVRLLEHGEAQFNPIGNVGSRFYLKTDLRAPRGRILAIDLERPERENWQEIVPQRRDVISAAMMVNRGLVIQYLREAHEMLQIHGLDGKAGPRVPLPTVGSIVGLSGRQEDREMFFGFTSFTYPTTIYRYDFDSRRAEVFRASEIDFDPSGFETRQVFFPSRDGTRVPMFLTQRKGLKRDGTHPALLYGYGGFNINITPTFSVSRLIWLEAGGIVAVANLRGGSEFGEEWHQAGMLERKQNVFDDFIAAAEYLIQKRYTRREKLAIQGGSNGGLLVTACLLQRPDLFGAAVAQVPVTDMLRYHRWTVGRYWVPEYGNAEENPEHFQFLRAYSPLHNIRPGVTHPALLVTS
ncbi:MAG: S9 family peptidase, partial [Acidobacteria bacterium]|nr:S9 family peptidase [Acidobacteriota bacterium]